MNRTQTCAFLVLLCGLALSGCVDKPQPAAPVPQTVSGVAVTRVRTASLPDWLESTGTVRAAQSAQLSSQSMGNLLEIRVREGDRVEGGEVVAVVDDAQPRAALDQSLAAETAAQKELSAADSEAALADSTLKRYQQLYEKKSVSPQEFDEVKSRRQSLAARHEAAAAVAAQTAAGVVQARKALDNTRIRAPFAGVVTEKKADTGALAVPGMPLLIIEDTRNYSLEVGVDEGSIGSIRVGEKAWATVEGLAARELSGTVAQILPAADPSSRTFLVKIALPATAGLRTGLFGRARFPRGSRSVILAPESAIVERGQLQGVYVVDENRIATLRYLTVGRSSGDEVEILSGLEGGETLLRAPGAQEYGGKKIAAQP